MKKCEDCNLCCKLPEINYFKDKKLNIIEINTFIEPAPITGSPLFNMEIKIECDHLSAETQIRKDLAQICNQLNLTLNY